MKRINKENMIKSCLVGGALLVSGGSVLAASQGSLGNLSSQGDIVINATIGDLIQISALNDINFGTVSATLAAQEHFCVYRNGGGNYAVALDSANGAAAGDYDLTSGGNRIAYTVRWDIDGDASDGTTVVEGAGAAGSYAGHTTSTTCGGSDNADLEVLLDSVEVAAAPAGAYTDTLTITVTPV